MHPEHHLHIRKRIAGTTEHPFPSPKPIVRFVDRLIMVVGVVGPFFSLPQLYNIWIRHDAAGVSPISWGGYSLMTALWLWYGLLHHEKPIIMAQTTWIFFNLAVTIGAIIY